MNSNIRIEKTCQFCGKKFIARTTVTKCCGDPCAKKAYKKRKREEKIRLAIEKEEGKPFNPAIKEKEFLSVKETCQLLGTSRWTIYRQIKIGTLKASKMGRRTIISKADIIKLLDGRL